MYKILIFDQKKPRFQIAVNYLLFKMVYSMFFTKIHPV
jgi:hypothetical protein